MEHTPGPWIAMEYAVNKNVISIYGTSDTPICNIFVTVYEKDLANAALISAAPDLKEVALAYESWEADILLNGDWSSSLPTFTQSQWNRWIEIQQMRNKALAKARGDKE